MGSSPEGLTTHAQEPVDPHFPSVKLPKATPRSKAPASWRDILHPTPDRVGPWAITTCLGAGCATSDVMITVGTNIMGFPDSKGSPAWLSGAKGYPSTPPWYIVEVLMEISEGTATPV